MTITLGESWVIINRGTTPLRCCQSSNPWHKCDKDMRCCATALTLCHFRKAAFGGSAVWSAGFLIFVLFRFMYEDFSWVSECPWLSVTVRETLWHTCIQTHSFRQVCVGVEFHPAPIYRQLSFIWCSHVISGNWFCRHLPKQMLSGAAKTLLDNHSSWNDVLLLYKDFENSWYILLLSKKHTFATGLWVVRWDCWSVLVGNSTYVDRLLSVNTSTVSLFVFLQL